MKRTWITVKRGILEPKHRAALGELIWLFIYILDLTNWEEGIIYDWLDKSAAEEMEMSLATLRDQRRKLEIKGYITCEQKQHGIRIIVHNWTNPKEYTGKKYNIKSPSDTPSDTPSFNVPSQNVASTYSQKSKDKNQKSIYVHPIQIMIEEITGKACNGMKDLKAVDELEKAGVIREDIQKGYYWYTVEMGNVFNYWSSIVKPSIYQMNKRIQEKQKHKTVEDITKDEPEIDYKAMRKQIEEEKKARMNDSR